MAPWEAGRIRRRGPESEPSACIHLRLIADPNGGFEGVHVLDELQGEVGVILWRCLRDIRLWALTPTRDRPHLFAPAATVDAVRAIRTRLDLPDDVAVAAAVLSDLPQVSAYADAGILASACAVVADWAGGVGAARTALSFAQAAALASPTRPAAAANAGFHALEAGDLRRAEPWLRRAAALGRHTDRITFAHARTALGALYAARGDGDRARSAYIQAIRATKGRPHALELRAQAAVGLHRLALARKDQREAKRAARVALRALGRHDPAIFPASVELAEHFLAEGRHGAALGLLTRIQDFPAAPPQRVHVLVLLARAAAARGDASTLRTAWKRVLAAVRSEPVGEESVRTLVELVRGAGAAAPRHQAAAVLRQAQEMARAVQRPELVASDLALRYLPAEGEERMGGR